VRGVIPGDEALRISPLAKLAHERLVERDIRKQESANDTSYNASCYHFAESFDLHHLAFLFLWLVDIEHQSLAMRKSLLVCTALVIPLVF
jgi:hypothetical protein